MYSFLYPENVMLIEYYFVMTNRLFQLFRDMQEQGIQPDVGVYNSLINGCATAGDIDKALQTLELMRSEGIEPTVITYTSLVQACSMVGGREAIEKGEEIFEAMQQRTNHFSSYVPPNQLTYEQVIYLHLNSGTDRMNTTRINELFRDMMSQHYLVDIPILRSCMKASMAINNIELARVTIEAFAKQQSESDIYNACVNTANEVCRKFGWGSIASFEMLFNLS